MVKINRSFYVRFGKDYRNHLIPITGLSHGISPSDAAWRAIKKSEIKLNSSHGLDVYVFDAGEDAEGSPVPTGSGEFYKFKIIVKLEECE